MILRSLKLENFRNYEKFDINLSDQTIFVGPNGIGKTNLIEAIYILAIGKSYRTSKEENLIKWGKEFMRIEGQIMSDNVEVFVANSPRKIKAVKINNIKKNTIDLFEKMKIILFSPESIEIIIGQPKSRRRFLDLILGQVDKKYLKNLIELQKILKNRNALLQNIKNSSSSKHELKFWNEKLIDSSIPIISKRKEFVKFINNRISKIYNNISEGKEKVKVNYLATVNNTDYYLDLLEKNIDKEIMYSSTLYGPHRDNLEFKINNLNASHSASRGEIRSFIFALKMVELDFLKEKEFKPIILLDDIFSELDRKRCQKLNNYIEKDNFVITDTGKENININSGKIKIVNLEKINNG